MTGEQLYELSSKGYKHDPWDKLNPLLQAYYNEQASTRHRVYNEEQRKPIHKGKQTCCGRCSGCGHEQDD